MLIGHVFKSQTFKNEAFGLFIDTFLQGNMGVVKGCELSSTNTTATVGEGYFCIKGRFLQILGTETVQVSGNGYYSLICEIDLSQENTKEDFNQGSIKVISNASAYPTLTQQDINNDGTMYQYEFARFRVTDSGITDFADRRTFLKLESIYSKINEDATAVLNQIQEALDKVLDESIYVLETDLETKLGEYQLKSELGSISAINYSRGTGTPSGGKDGDIYDQYFN